jgi:hypothetical protein
MVDGWNFYRFDFAKYVAVRPVLRVATTASVLAGLVEDAETQAIVDALSDGEIPPLEARQAFVKAACCVGEPLFVDRGFPRLLAGLTRHRDGAEVAELLGELLAGKKNLEPWLMPPAGLTGFLNPQETRQMVGYLSRYVAAGGFREGRAGRGGGGPLWTASFRFVLRLFDRAPQSHDLLLLLEDFFEEAVRRKEGVAVVAIG